MTSALQVGNTCNVINVCAKLLININRDDRAKKKQPCVIQYARLGGKRHNYVIPLYKHNI